MNVALNECLPQTCYNNIALRAVETDKNLRSSSATGLAWLPSSGSDGSGGLLCLLADRQQFNV